MSLEKKVSDTILQKPIEVKFGEKSYQIARPTLATLIEVSKYASELPAEENIEKDNIVPYILNEAKGVGLILARITAVLIIGGQNIRKTRVRRLKRKFAWINFYEEEEKSNVDDLAEEIVKNASCEELSNVISLALSHQNIGFFLSIIISLKGANISQQKKGN